MSESMSIAIKELNYEDLNKYIKITMKRSAKEAIQLGYMLRRMIDEKLWEKEYDCLDEYLREELKIDYTMAMRFVAINKKYSLSGDSAELADYVCAILNEAIRMEEKAGRRASWTDQMMRRFMAVN